MNACEAKAARKRVQRYGFSSGNANLRLNFLAESDKRSTFVAEMKSEYAIFNRTERLVGSGGMQAISAARVIIFGVGGVGSWVAEGLVRSGVVRITLVDSDRVSITNVNRQCPATTKTIGEVKVNAMKNRLLEINPDAEIEAVEGVYDSTTCDTFNLESYDYVIDAIDSLECKALLILKATSLPRSVKFFSSMGAALKMDPTKIRVAEFWQVEGCPLARALRQRFKRNHLFPARKFQVVYSPEVLPNRGNVIPVEDDVRQHVDWNARKAQVNGTVAHITAIFGFTLAGLVLQDICAGS